MDGFGSYGSDRRSEIVVSGRKNSSQIYATQSPRVAPPPSKPWGFTDRGMKRKKRIARYKVYSVEGKVKASIKASLRWIKNKCSEIVHGY